MRVVTFHSLVELLCLMMTESRSASQELNIIYIHRSQYSYADFFEKTFFNHVLIAIVMGKKMNHL